MPQLNNEFWDSGVTTKDPQARSKAKHPNPMFSASPYSTSTIHYGTEPILGFHTATAYAPLQQNSPLHPGTGHLLDKHTHKTIQAAQVQFGQWSKSFRKSVERNIVLRFYAGDALSFGHTLSHNARSKDNTSGNWYRDIWHMEPLTLD